MEMSIGNLDTNLVMNMEADVWYYGNIFITDFHCICRHHRETGSATLIFCGDSIGHINPKNMCVYRHKKSVDGRPNILDD